MNFFQKIYWGWYQIKENLWGWHYRMTEGDYHDPDFWIGLNINLSYVLETFFWYHRDYPEALNKIANRNDD